MLSRIELSGFGIFQSKQTKPANLGRKSVRLGSYIFQKQRSECSLQFHASEGINLKNAVGDVPPPPSSPAQITPNLNFFPPPRN